MRYLSLFSGIEACTTAWHGLGWEPVAFCEYDKFPSAVLKHHYPDIPNLGDVTQITDEQLKALGHIDLVVGGSPCQDLSIAGKRAGFADGTRSNLFHEQMRIFHAARHLCGARFLLWENVPGAFSSNEGGDFATVVGEMAGFAATVPPEGWENTGVAIGENGLCEWGVLDAQWFGVPQRRRRVFAILDTGNWQSRPPILFEPESLRGDTPPCREAGKDIASDTYESIEEYSKPVGALCDGAHHGGGLNGQDAYSGRILPVIEPMALAENTIGRQPHNGGNGDGFTVGGPMYTLNATGCHGIATAFNSRQDPVCTGDVTGALDTCTPLAQAVYENHPGDSRVAEVDVCPTVTGKWGTGGGNVPYHRNEMTVRRLTPIECERLQGFPDNYTQIPYRGKPADKCPDGARYKALGNSMAVPVMKWIGQRIDDLT